MNFYSEESENELLMREFEKIKKQKEEEHKKQVFLKFTINKNFSDFEKLKEKQEEIEQNRQESLLKGNPLLDTESYSLKRR